MKCLNCKKPIHEGTKFCNQNCHVQYQNCHVQFIKHKSVNSEHTNVSIELENAYRVLQMILDNAPLTKHVRHNIEDVQCLIEKIIYGGYLK